MAQQPIMRRDRGGKADPITVVIHGPLAQDIRRIHQISQIGEDLGNKTGIWCLEIIENFVYEKRKGVLQ